MVASVHHLAGFDKEIGQPPGNRRANLNRVTFIFQLGNNSAVVNWSAHFTGIDYSPGLQSSDFRWLQQRMNLRSSRSIPESHQRQRRVAAHHERRVVEHLEQRFVKACHGSILSHHPGLGVANFFHRIRSQAYHIGIPARYTRIVLRHPRADLHQRVLDVTRLLIVMQILADLFIRELSSEPGVPPEQERHEHDQPGGNEKQDALSGRHAAAGFGIAGRDFRRI